MLRAQFVHADLDPACPIEVEETRGRLLIKCSTELFSDQAVASLNSAAEGILAGNQWFQLWNGEIVSRASSENPLAA